MKKRSFHWKLCCSQQVRVARWRSVLETILTITKQSERQLFSPQEEVYHVLPAMPPQRCLQVSLVRNSGQM